MYQFFPQVDFPSTSFYAHIWHLKFIDLKYKPRPTLVNTFIAILGYTFLICSIFQRKKSKKDENPLMSQFSAPISPDVPVKFPPPYAGKREDYIAVVGGVWTLM